MYLKEGDYSTLYAGLDDVLDTRMATLFGMGEEVATKAIDFNYHDRISDLIPGINYEEFKRRYDARDKKVLGNAMRTPVYGLMREFAERTRENALNSPYQYVPEIMLNVHPYVLSDDEMNVIRAAIKAATLGYAEVKIINKPLAEITPLFVKNNLSMMVMYRYDEWIEMHCLNKLFEKTTCPEVTLIGPAVYFKKPEVIPKDDENPFEDMEKQAAPLIGLQLRPASLFSMVLKPKKKT